MADAAAARREARRRKILENSHNRLQLLSGKQNSECSQNVPVTSISDVNLELPVAVNYCHSEPTELSNGVFISEHETFSTVTPRLVDAPGNEEIVNDIAAFLSTQSKSNQTQTQTLTQKLVNNKYDIVLLSILIQLLHNFTLLLFDNFYYVFPIIVYTVTKVLMFPPQENSKIANALLLLNGMSHRHTERIISVIRWISMLSQELCVFLFTTISIQCVLLSIDQLLT